MVKLLIFVLVLGIWVGSSTSTSTSFDGSNDSPMFRRLEVSPLRSRQTLLKRPSSSSGPLSPRYSYEDEDGHVVYHRHFHVYNHEEGRGIGPRGGEVCKWGECLPTSASDEKFGRSCNNHGTWRGRSKGNASCGSGKTSAWCCKAGYYYYY